MKIVTYNIDREGVHHGWYGRSLIRRALPSIKVGQEYVSRVPSGRSVPRGETAPPYRDLRRDRLDRVVGLREKREVRRGRSTRSVEWNCGSQKRFRFGSLAMITCSTDGASRTTAAAYEAKSARACDRQRRRTRSRVHDRHVQADAVPPRRVAHVLEDP